MTTRGFEPRQYLVDPTHFGIDGEVAFAYPKEAAPRRGRLRAITPETAMVAAQFQHVLATKVHTRIRLGKEKTLKNFVLALVSHDLVVRHRTPKAAEREVWRKPYDLVNGWVSGARSVRSDDIALMRRALGWGILPSDEEMKVVEAVSPLGPAPRSPRKTRKERDPGTAAFEGDELMEKVFGIRPVDEWMDEPLLTEEDIAADAAFDEGVAAVALPYLREAAQSMRRAGPEELWRCEPALEESTFTVLPAAVYEPGAGDRYLTGQCGYYMVHPVAYLDDDWVDTVGAGDWAVIGGHFVLKVLGWEGAGADRRPAEVIAGRLREGSDEDYSYSSGRAWVTYVADEGALEFIDVR